MAADNIISRGIQAYQKIIPNPIVQALVAGGALYGIGRLAWNPIVDTVRSVARIPGRKLGDMTDEEWDEAMDELQNNSSYRRWIPAAFAGLAGMGALVPSYKANKAYGGLFSWNPKTRYYQRQQSTFSGDSVPLFANGRMPKKGSMFLTDGYVPTVDFSQAINTRNAVNMFTNDPYLQDHPYAMNMGTAIVADAARREGTNNVPLGSIFDSAVDKLDTKLSLSGLTSIGVKTVISNATARLFAGALGAVTGLSPENQRTLVDTGTWAGAITAILE